MKMNKTNSKMSLPWRQQLQVLFKQFHTTADVDKNEEYTHEYLRKKAKTYKFLFTIVKGLLQIYLSTEDMALEKKFHITVWCKFDWKSQPTVKKKNPRFCFWHAHSYYINLIFHLVEKRYKEKNCF